MYQLIQIQIYVSDLPNGWVILGHLSLFTSIRGVYLLLQIQIYVSILQNGGMTLCPSSNKVYPLLQEVCINCFKSKYMLVFYKMDG